MKHLLTILFCGALIAACAAPATPTLAPTRESQKQTIIFDTATPSATPTEDIVATIYAQATSKAKSWPAIEATGTMRASLLNLTYTSVAKTATSKAPQTIQKPAIKPTSIVRKAPTLALVSTKPPTAVTIPTVFLPPTAVPPSSGCCKRCDPAKSKPCGDSCISLDKTCHTPSGCACSK